MSYDRFLKRIDEATANGAEPARVVQILEGGLQIVSHESWWTKGALCNTSSNGGAPSGCALGAGAVAAGVVPLNDKGLAVWKDETPYYPGGSIGAEDAEYVVAMAWLGQALIETSVFDHDEFSLKYAMSSKLRWRRFLGNFASSVVATANDGVDTEKHHIVKGYTKAIEMAKAHYGME